jgi:hypothetical protein
MSAAVNGIYRCSLLYLESTATISAITASTATTTVISSTPIPAVISTAFATVFTTFSFGTDEIRIQVTLGKNFALTNPNLDSDLSVYGQGEY